MQKSPVSSVFEVPRPMPMLQTEYGSLPFTTVELQQQLESPYFSQLELTDLVQRGKTELALDDICSCLPKPAILSVRHMQNGIPEMVSNGVQMHTANGKQSVTNADYIHHIRREKPAAVIALADEVGPHCGRNRRDKSLKRSIMWLKELCEQKESLGCRIYGVCVGGSQIHMRRQCAEEMKDLPIDGVVIGELFCGETPAERRECILAVREVIGDDKPLIVQGHGDPLDIIDLVRSGVSYIASDYIRSITTNRLALTWDLGTLTEPATGGSPDAARKRKIATSNSEKGKRQRGEVGDAVKADEPEQDDQTVQEFAGTGSTTSVVNLLDRHNELLHTTKLMEGCNCHTCRRPHSRAYIHHLLRAHELTADILIYQHNQWQWLRLFDAIRHHVQQGTLDTFETRIRQQITGV